MRINKDFEIVEIANEYMAVPLGNAAASLNGVVALSEASVYLLRQMEQPKTKEELLELLLREYDVEEDIAKGDIENFISELINIGLIIE